jgi:four helix bundle protein
MRNFRAYQLAVDFYHQCQKLCLPKHLRDQLHRASSSIALCLAEGRGKRTLADQKRFFQMAFGSIRECQAVFDLHPTVATPPIHERLDHLAASVFLLLKRAG